MRALPALPRPLANSVISNSVRSRCSVFDDNRPVKHETLVLEEDVTGLKPGFPIIPESEIWKNPDMLLPERFELWYDDGTAQPEFYVDNQFPVSDERALAECVGAIVFIVGGVYMLARALGDRLDPARGASWQETSLPYDLSREFGGMKRQWKKTFDDDEEAAEEE